LIAFLGRRLLTMVWTLIAISILVFIIIQLPPGDYLTTYIAEIQAQGEASPRSRLRSCANSTASTSRCGSNTSSGPPASCVAISAIPSNTTSPSPT
jgi:ABC-type microcin C transport system permease subunit YejB